MKTGKVRERSKPHENRTANHMLRAAPYRFCPLRYGPAQASTLRSEASQALRCGDKIEDQFQKEIERKTHPL
jgi:hypothetical protein